MDSSIPLPKVESGLFASEHPTYLKRDVDVPPRPTTADLRVRQADEHFKAGKRAYDEGDLEKARAEFDAAVDTLLGAPEGLADRNKVEKKLEELTAAIFRYDVNGMGLGDLSAGPGYDKAPLEDILDMTFPVNPSIKPLVREQVQATSSQLPLEVNDTVLSYINYFSGERGRKTLLFGLRRAGRYRDLISKTLAEEGVPQELIYLAQAESGFLPRAVSHKAATGMWQFVQWRGREYGLEQSAYHDDRLDPEKATRSAARHLRDLYEQFGDWYLAIAAYNCGPGCVDKAVQRTGYADFWELRSRKAIPRETSNYVPIILAMTIMAKNPKAYGLEDLQADEPLVYETLDLNAKTHLALVADLVERPVSDLRELNPALTRNIAPAGYKLRLPIGTTDRLEAGLRTIPEQYRASWRVHRMAPGDTLAGVAKRYRTSLVALSSVNQGVESAGEGDMLVIPTKSEEERVVKSAGKKSRTARKGRTAKAQSTVATSRKSGHADVKATRKPVRKVLTERASVR